MKSKEEIINELELTIELVDKFKKREGWTLLGFELTLHNALNWLKEE